MESPVNNLDDLHKEIHRLEKLEQEQSLAVKDHFNGFKATASTFYSLFTSSEGLNNEKAKELTKQDLFGLVSKYVLPLTLNKTLFKNSNFIIKSLIGVVSQKASHLISENSVLSFWNKVKERFANNEKKNESTAHTPTPVSETIHSENSV